MVHCAAIYDITADEPEQRAANVEGTRAVIDLARRLDATLHHVSSIAVAGDFPGEYTEDDFDIGQQLPDAVSPDEVRGRIAGALRVGAAVPDLPAGGGGRRFAHRRDGQDRRAVLLLRRAGQAGRPAPADADHVARHRPHQHRAG